MSLIEQIEKDKSFGSDIMQAAGIRTLGVLPSDGLHINILAWFSNGKQVGPVFAYLGNEGTIQIMWPYGIKEPRLYQSTLKKALPIIKKTNHTGHVGIRCLVNAHDQKSYGIRWQTTLTKEIIRVTGELLKTSFAEWSKWLTEGAEGNWLMNEFHYRYAGSVIDQLNETNSKLIVLRAMGYEIPFNMANISQDE